MNRRDALKTTLAATALAGELWAGESQPPQRKPPFRLIFEAEWNDIPCADYPLTSEKWVAECIRPLVGTQVDTLFYNLGSSDGFVCELQSAQILMDNFDKLGDAWVWRYRENTKKLIATGANPPDLAVKHGHALGLKVVPIVRMNDPHDQFFRYEVSQYKLDHPELLLGAKMGYTDFARGHGGHPQPFSLDGLTWGMFDYAHPEVREHRLAIIREFITRWDNDGMSLDFERDPRFFVKENNPQNAELMTDLIRQVRKLLDEKASASGRRQSLHVKVLPRIDVNLARGLDVETWVREGLVDAISPGAGYMTFALDLAPWKKLVENHACWIYPASNHWKTAEVTRAWAKFMYGEGADGLYLFNFGHLLYGFDKQSSPAAERLGSVWLDELHPAYYEALRQIGNPETLLCQSATYDLDAIGHYPPSRTDERSYRAVQAVDLPITLSIGSHEFKLPYAEDLEAAHLRGCTAAISLRLKISNFTEPDRFIVSINGTALNNQTRTSRAVFIMNNDSWVMFPIKPALLHQGNNAVVIDMQSINPQMSVVPELSHVELVVKYH